MFAGKRFRLTTPILAVNVEDHLKTGSINIPIGAILEVVSGPTDGDGMMDVLWDARTVAVFSIDLNVRGTELLSKVPERSASSKNIDSPLRTNDTIALPARVKPTEDMPRPGATKANGKPKRAKKAG
jgi:hypothetical protein